MGVGGATNQSTGLSVYSGSIGGTAGNMDYPAEFETGCGNRCRLQIAGYRWTTGGGWTGAGFRLQFAVDNSFTDGSRSSIYLGSDQSSNGIVSMTVNSVEAFRAQPDAVWINVATYGAASAL